MSDKNTQTDSINCQNDHNSLRRLQTKIKHFAGGFLNGIAHFYNKFFNELARFRKSRCGAILIEFAFSMPLFLVLIYHVHDLPKMKRWNRKIQFVAHEMAMILQNIGAKRTITKQDFMIATRLAYLSVFPGTTMKGTQNRAHPLGYYPYAAVMYVKGAGQNKAQGKWIAKASTDSGYQIYLDKNVASVCNWRFFEQSTDANKFWSTLKISGEESKIIIQCHLYYDRLGKWGDKFTDGTYCKNVSPRKAFGFLFLEPKGVGTAGGGFFTSTIIVTPNSGFTENFPR